MGDECKLGTEVMTRGSRIVLLLLVLSLAFLAGLSRPSNGGPLSSVAGHMYAKTAAPVADGAAPVIAARKKPARRERRGEARRDRGHDEQRPDRAKRAPKEPYVACEGAGRTRLARSDACTHGPDPAPLGVDLTRRARPTAPTAITRAAAALECDGDGQSGPRVQVLYAHAANVPNRYVQFLASPHRSRCLLHLSAASWPRRRA